MSKRKIFVVSIIGFTFGYILGLIVKDKNEIYERGRF